MNALLSLFAKLYARLNKVTGSKTKLDATEFVYLCHGDGERWKHELRIELKGWRRETENARKEWLDVTMFARP